MPRAHSQRSGHTCDPGFRRMLHGSERQDVSYEDQAKARRAALRAYARKEWENRIVDSALWIGLALAAIFGSMVAARACYLFAICVILPFWRWLP